MRNALGIFGTVAGAIVVALVGRYGFVTSDTAIDGAIAAFFLAVIAIGGIAGPAAALHMFQHVKGWRKLLAILAGAAAIVALLVNITNSLGAIAGRADKTLATRAKVAETRKDDRATLARLTTERAGMTFTPATADAVLAAREAVAAAERAQKAECERRGRLCREREAEETAKRDALAVVLANRAATERAERLERDAAAVQARLDVAAPVASVNPLADTLGRIFSIPSAAAATAQQVAMVVIVEILIAFSLIAWELLPRSHAAPRLAAVETEPLLAPQATAELDPLPSNVVALIQPPKRGNIEAFLLACVGKAKGSSVSWAELYVRYRRWCEESSLEPYAVREFGTQLDSLRADGVLRVRARGQDVYCLDVKLVA